MEPTARHVLIWTRDGGDVVIEGIYVFFRVSDDQIKAIRKAYRAEEEQAINSDDPAAFDRFPIFRDWLRERHPEISFQTPEFSELDSHTGEWL